MKPGNLALMAVSACVLFPCKPYAPPVNLHVDARARLLLRQASGSEFGVPFNSQWATNFNHFGPWPVFQAIWHTAEEERGDGRPRLDWGYWSLSCYCSTTPFPDYERSILFGEKFFMQVQILPLIWFLIEFGKTCLVVSRFLAEWPLVPCTERVKVYSLCDISYPLTSPYREDSNWRLREWTIKA